MRRDEGRCSRLDDQRERCTVGRRQAFGREQPGHVARKAAALHHGQAAEHHCCGGRVVPEESSQRVARCGNLRTPGHRRDWKRHTIKDCFGHQFEELILVAQVPVEGCGLHAKPVRKRAHRQSIDTDGVEHRQSSLDDRFAIEPGCLRLLTGHRSVLRCLGQGSLAFSV